MTTTNLPDWVKIDGPVYLHAVHGYGHSRVTKAKITKITARDIVVGNYRFRKDRLTRGWNKEGDLYFDGPNGQYHHPSLLGPNDPRVEQIAEAQRLRTIETTARNAAGEFQSDRSVEKALAAIGALTAFVEAAQQ